MHYGDHNDKDYEPLISVITATFNSGKYLENTILSVLKQSYNKIEYIIVDGDSTDNTMEIVNKYKKYIACIIKEKDKGVYDAFNKGLSKASGDIVFFLNSDDYLLYPNVFIDIINVFKINPSSMGVYGKILYRDECIDLWEPAYLQRITLETVKQGVLPPHPAFFAKKALYDEIGTFNLDYKIAADTDFMIRSFKKYPDSFFFIDKWMTGHRRGGISTNLKGFDVVRNEVQVLMNKHFNNKIYGYNSAEKMSAYYRVWLEKLLFEEAGVSRVLSSINIKKVVILGVNRIGACLVKDFKKSGIEVVAFVDINNPIVNLKVQNVIVQDLTWLDKNINFIDAVIFSYDSFDKMSLLQKIVDFVKQNGKYVFKWNELIEFIEN